MNGVEKGKLHLHEDFSITRMLTGITKSWYLESMVESNWQTFLLGRIGSRLVNLLILPTSLIDSIINVAIGVFTLVIAAPISLIYNFLNWHKNQDGESRFTFSGGFINLMNAKKHFPMAPFAMLAGICNPENVAIFFAN